MELFMKITRKILFWTLAFILLAQTSGAAQSYETKREKAHAVKIRVGDTPPDFTATDMNGNEIVLSEILGKKPIVIDFWATWCPPCVKSMPYLEEFFQKYSEQVVVLCITSEPLESLDKIKKFIEDKKLSMTFIQNPTGDIGKAYGVRAIPSTFAIGIDGKIAYAHVGFSDKIVQELEEALELQ